MNIEDRIAAFTKIVPQEPITASVAFGHTFEAIRKIDKALSLANDDDRITLIADLFRLWCDSRDRQEEARRVFGELLRYASTRLMFTVSGNGQQLRVWFGLPASMSWDHVDSCGQNLLFGVYGHPQEVERYLKELLKVKILQEIRAPQVRLFMQLRG